MSKVYITHPYLLAPQHKITVNLIGAGGTGSQVLNCLARMHRGLQALGHTGLHVRVYDHDTVSVANIGRQLFSPADEGMNKAIASVTRINRFFGLAWEAYPERFADKRDNAGNITISCVDTAKGRLEINKHLQSLSHKRDNHHPHYNQYYWLDFGNAKGTGQVVLGTVYEYGIQELKNNNYKDIAYLPRVTDLFDLSAIKEKNQGPSCSLAEAIGRQGLFINSTLANLGMEMLWELFARGKLTYHGLYLNLDNMQVRPIPIPANTTNKFKTNKK